MADIYEFVNRSNNRRPIYTTYELSKMVREKRRTDGLGVQEFAEQYGIDSEVLLKIEKASCSFSPKIYKICGKILNLSTEELVGEIIDDDSTVNFRACGNEDECQETFEFANMLFNEIIMQKKLSVN